MGTQKIDITFEVDSDLARQICGMLDKLLCDDICTLMRADPDLRQIAIVSGKQWLKERLIQHHIKSTYPIEWDNPLVVAMHNNLDGLYHRFYDDYCNVFSSVRLARELREYSAKPHAQIVRPNTQTSADQKINGQELKVVCMDEYTQIAAKLRESNISNSTSQAYVLPHHRTIADKAIEAMIKPQEM